MCSVVYIDRWWNYVHAYKFIMIVGGIVCLFSNIAINGGIVCFFSSIY